MTIQKPLTITAVFILGTTLLFWVGLLLTLLGITDVLKNLISAGGPATVVYGMVLGPVIGIITAVSALRQPHRQ